MSDIEELIGQVMAEHDDEAPRSADLLRALAHAEASAETTTRIRGTSRLLPVAAGLAVAAVMVGSAWAGGLIGGRTAMRTSRDRTTRLATLSCPASYRGTAPWVPARPAGVGGRSRLVPLRTPTSAVVCGYLPGSRREGRAGLIGKGLTRQRQLTGGLAALVADLAWQPRLLPGQQIPCSTVLGPQSNYLIGLAYRGGGRIWVSTTANETGCIMTSNGEFTTFGDVSAEAAKAARAGRWPEPLQQASCGHGGRFGQEAMMVPAGSTSLTICGRGVGRMVTSGYQDLVAALNALPTRTSTWGCSSTSSFHGQDYQLEFAYPQGPAVQVWVSPDCSPAINNFSLQAYSAKSVLPIIKRLMHTG